jgi:carbon-monoxide dehydrogenase iron sulfur subunit
MLSEGWGHKMLKCDISLCVGCRMCEVACSTFHFGAVSPALARIRVAKLEESGIDLSVACLSCLEKPCLECPTDALSPGLSGEILLDAGLCNACEACVEACPIGAVGFHQDHPLFCDLCGGALSCVAACPSLALTYDEAHRGVSLAAFIPGTGIPAVRRADYARAQAKALRDRWAKGERIDDLRLTIDD